jgi:hypothetical protein
MEAAMMKLHTKPAPPDKPAKAESTKKEIT